MWGVKWALGEAQACHQCVLVLLAIKASGVWKNYEEKKYNSWLNIEYITTKITVRMVVVKERDVIKQWAVEFKKKIWISKSYGRIKKSRSTAAWARNQEEIKFMPSKIFLIIIYFQITCWVPPCLFFRSPMAKQGSSAHCWVSPSIEASQLSLTWAVTLTCLHCLDKELHFTPGTRGCVWKCVRSSHERCESKQTPAFYKTLTYSAFASAMKLTAN